jgi:ABC-type dipeptide/oligopeptide/nickel transport system permease component
LEKISGSSIMDNMWSLEHLAEFLVQLILVNLYPPLCNMTYACTLFIFSMQTLVNLILDALAVVNY